MHARTSLTPRSTHEPNPPQYTRGTAAGNGVPSRQMGRVRVSDLLLGSGTLLGGSGLGWVLAGIGFLVFLGSLHHGGLATSRETTQEHSPAVERRAAGRGSLVQAQGLRSLSSSEQSVHAGAPWRGSYSAAPDAGQLMTPLKPRRKSPFPSRARALKQDCKATQLRGQKLEVLSAPKCSLKMHASHMASQSDATHMAESAEGILNII